jgi:hypothetical protein
MEWGGFVKSRAHNGCIETAVVHHDCTTFIKEIAMLGFIARWGHNVLLAALGVLTVAVVILAR